MSAFLDTVHHWMYQKIQMQELVTAKLMGLSKDNVLSKQMEQKYV